MLHTLSLPLPLPLPRRVHQPIPPHRRTQQSSIRTRHRARLPAADRPASLPFQVPRSSNDQFWKPSLHGAGCREDSRAWWPAAWEVAADCSSSRASRCSSHGRTWGRVGFVCFLASGLLAAYNRFDGLAWLSMMLARGSLGRCQGTYLHRCLLRRSAFGGAALGPVCAPAEMGYHTPDLHVHIARCAGPHALDG